MMTWEALGQFFLKPITLRLPEYSALLAALVAAVWAGLWWWSVRRARQAEAPDFAPVTLWECLCRVHDLSHAEVALLSALGETAGVADHCLLFVDPRWLERAAVNGDDEAAEFARLGRQLFGDVFRAAA
jgi:hypothetical protein